MKSLLFGILAAASLVLSFDCHALISVEFVSKERAKELGVTFKIHRNGEAGYAVTMDFEKKGELEKITYVRLQLGQGKERIMSSQLRVTDPKPGTQSVRFSAFPAYLPESYLMIVVYNGPKGYVGYRFKVEEFLDLKDME